MGKYPEMREIEFNFAHHFNAMSKKRNEQRGGLVYSTASDFTPFHEEEEQVGTLPKEKQKLKVITDSKQRAGKIVTLVIGFIGSAEDLELLGKQLKTKCGAGGSVKDGEIIIQGNYKEKIVPWLKDWGYTLTK